MRRTWMRPSPSPPESPARKKARWKSAPSSNCKTCRETDVNFRITFTESVEYFPSPLGGEGGRRPDEGDELETTSVLNRPPHPNPLPPGERGQNRWNLRILANHRINLILATTSNAKE